MAGSFQYATRAEVLKELSVRCEDVGMVHWIRPELALYLFEALQVWNCLTQWWTQKYTFSLIPPLANWQASPRLRSTVDEDVFSIIEFHFLEPPAGEGWTGTTQFNIQDLTQAVQRRQDEILQITACNLEELALNIMPGTNLVPLPDVVLDVRRVRYLPVQGYPQTLERADTLAFQRFSSFYQQTRKDPLRWDIIAGPPLLLNFDALAQTPNAIEVLAMQAGTPLAPPAVTPLVIPNDWAWVLKFGAMYDLFSQENECKDQQRADYCRQRYLEGLQLMLEMPWVLQAWINEFPADVVSLAHADRFNYEWQSRAQAYPAIVLAGIDMWGISPIPAITTGVTLLVVDNANIPYNDTDLIQLPRDVLDAILDEAQHLAAIKHGGLEFSETVALHKSFIDVAMKWNSRLRMSGIFSTDLRPGRQKQFLQQPRFAASPAQGGQNAGTA